MADNNQQMVVLNRVIAQQELNIREVQKNQTVLLGIASGQEHDIQELKAHAEQGDVRLERIEQRLNGIEQRLETIIALLTSSKPPTSPES